MVELLAGFADRGRIDQRHESGGVGHQHGVEQYLIPRLKIAEQEVSEQVGVGYFELGADARDLDFQRGRHGGKHALDFEGPALGNGEGGAAVLARIAQQERAGEGGFGH